MTIDQLAARAGTTTRNLRALQTSGLLIKPEIVGRTARYGEDHLARVLTVLDLQSEGFSIASIRALFHALSAGLSLADVLRVSATPSTSATSAASAASPTFSGPVAARPRPSADPFEGAKDDAADAGMESASVGMQDTPGDMRITGPRRHLRLLSDIPSTVLDAVI